MLGHKLNRRRKNHGFAGGPSFWDPQGYAPDRWDRIVYILPGSDCGFRGVALGHEAIITSTPRPSLLVHELGHTYGLAHAGASECPSCPILDQGDPFSPMGSGYTDFSAYEKHLLGWIGTPARLAHDGSYPLSRADRSSALLWVPETRFRLDLGRLGL